MAALTAAMRSLRKDIKALGANLKRASKLSKNKQKVQQESVKKGDVPRAAVFGTAASGTNSSTGSFTGKSPYGIDSCNEFKMLENQTSIGTETSLVESSSSSWAVFPDPGNTKTVVPQALAAPGASAFEMASPIYAPPLLKLNLPTFSINNPFNSFRDAFMYTTDTRNHVTTMQAAEIIMSCAAWGLTPVEHNRVCLYAQSLMKLSRDAELKESLFKLGRAQQSPFGDDMVWEDEEAV